MSGHLMTASQSVSQSVSQSISQSVSQSVRQPASQLVISQSVSLSPPVSQAVSRAVGSEVRTDVRKTVLRHSESGRKCARVWTPVARLWQPPPALNDAFFWGNPTSAPVTVASQARVAAAARAPRARGAAQRPCLEETARPASGPRPFLWIRSCGRRPGPARP
eukprot:gene10372-biopygen18287